MKCSPCVNHIHMIIYLKRGVKHHMKRAANAALLLLSADRLQHVFLLVNADFLDAVAFVRANDDLIFETTLARRFAVFR
jgi:hypothetical protein